MQVPSFGLTTWGLVDKLVAEIDRNSHRPTGIDDVERYQFPRK